MPALRLLALILIVMLIAAPAASLPVAQTSEPVCIELVARAVETVGSACDIVNRNQACYGNRLIDVAFRPDQNPLFTQSGDVADIQTISRISTNPYDGTTTDWGIVIVKAQADLPNALPGQNVTFLLFGDATLDNPTPDMRSVTVESNFLDEVVCEEAPSGVVIQSPGGTQVEMTLNGADVYLGSTVYVSAFSATELLLATLDGTAVVIILDQVRVVAAGNYITVPIDEDFQVNGEPSDAQPYDPALVSYLPLTLLDEEIVVPEVTDAPTVIAATRTPTRTPTPICVPRADWTTTYLVQPGDTLGNIAARLGVSVNSLQLGNCIADPNLIRAGDRLRVPYAVPTVVPPSVTFTADQYTLNAGQCTTLRWNVPGQTTYITNSFEQTLTPTGSQTYCPSYGTETIYLIVGRPDDTTETYSLTLTVLDVCGDAICGASEDVYICAVDCATATPLPTDTPVPTDTPSP